MKPVDNEKQNEVKDKFEPIGLVIFIIGFFILVLAIILFIVNTNIKFELLGISLGMISVGLGFWAIGISVKSDKRYTEILSKLDTKITKVLEFVDTKIDKVDAPIHSSGNVIIAAPTAQATTTAYPPEVEITADANWSIFNSTPLGEV